ncbi:hypothetical protein [Thermococcus sp.]
MKKLLAGVLILGVLLAIAGGYSYLQEKGPSKKPDTTRAKILSYLGGLECYSYVETGQITRTNQTVNITLWGGKYNDTYYFHEKVGELEWYGIIVNSTLKEKILVNGTFNNVTAVLSRDEKAMFLSFDPVRVAIHAIGVGKLLEKDKTSATYSFNITVSPSRVIRMGGTITVFWSGKNVEKIVLNVSVIYPSGIYEKRELTAVLGACKRPHWLNKLSK